MVVPESSINNIMGGLESTGGVRLHNHKRKLRQRFDIVKKLGQGTYGKVQLGINKETGQEVAIKTIKKCKIETEADLIRIRREIQIMSSVQHPNIIHIYEVFENREKMVLVMEYAAGGELYDFLSERKVLAEEEARRIFRQISTAVYYCHKHKICHRDLKLENILLDENGNAKIADFGLSNVFDESRLLSTFCGSPLYASPEIVKGTPYHGPEVDCWSLGVLLYTLVYGAMPFDGSNFKRLVRQISQGDYFEPKKPSPASSLIRDMLNVNPARRADIVAICSHWWIDENQSEPCMEVAEELANQTPVRLDLLLCLAPSGDNDKLLLADQPPMQEGGDRPLRSQSLSSLATAQPDFLSDAPSSQTRRDTESRSKRKEEGGSMKRKERSRSRRERSSSRSRRDDSTPEPDSVSDKPKRRSVKSKKNREEPQVVEEPKEDETLQPKIAEVEEELVKSSETILAPATPVEDVPKSKSPVPSDEVVFEEIKTEDPATPTTPVVPEVPKQPSPVGTAPTTQTQTQPSTPVSAEKSEEKENVPEEEKPAKPMERRKSKIFETAEKFNKIGVPDAQPKPQPKKMVLPGVKVSDAKKAYERRSSLASSTTNFIRGSASRKSLSGESSLSPPPVDDTKFSLASTVALNKLVENVEKLSKMQDEKERNMDKTEERRSADKVKPSPEKVIEVKKEESKTDNEGKVEDEARKKVKNAVQVIGNAITEGISGEGKSATLPRRRTSRAEIKLSMPPPKPVEFRSEVEHMVGAPPPPASAASVQRSEVKFPVSAPSPVSRPAVRQGSTPREYIVPIQMEQESTTAAVKPPPPPTTSQRPVSRTSSKSLSRQSTADSDLGSTASIGEPIRKSPREVIIPIAVEGGGYVTPSADAISRMSSLNESEDDLPRGFGLHSTRRHARQLETADSVSSDEDDDNFEILTAENLFSTLLSRVRSLTQRLNTEDRQTAFPRLFNHHHSIFDIPPSRRLTEARSFGRADSVPWRRSMSREASTLPRGGSINRIGAPQRTGSLKSSGKDKPPPYRTAMRSTTENSRHLYSPANSSNSEQSVKDKSSEGTNVTIMDVTGDSKLQCKALNDHESSNEKSPKTQSPRGIPTSEIVGSSMKKVSRSESIPETSKKSSRLPRLLVKNAQENRQENETESSPSAISNVIENTSSHSAPRRNSLERPSYYNSLYKTGCRPYNENMTRSLNLPPDHVLNGDMSPNSTATFKNDSIDKLNKCLPSSMIDGDKQGSEFDYHSIRPYGTLGRTFSFKNPSVRSYGTLKPPIKSNLENDAELKYSNQTTNMSRGSSMKEGERFSSRFLRPKSFYGGTDLSSYSVPSSPSSATSTGDPMPDPFSERKSAFVGRRSPSYHRSLSLFEGKKPEIYPRSLSVTPDKSVLGKFFGDKNTANVPAKELKENNRDKPKNRKVSRFLRPDFYDTPKEDSVYEKKEKVKNETNGQIWKEKAKLSGSTQKKTSKKSQEEKIAEHRMSIVDKAIRSLKENSLGKNDHESMARESNLIKRAVSLEDCSLVPENRVKRSTSLTPQSNYGKKFGSDKFESMFQKKKFEDYKKIVDQKLNNKNKEVKSVNRKQESVIKKIARKLSPKNMARQEVNESKCNGIVSPAESQTLEETNQDGRSRLSRIAGLKRLEFNRPVPSADSTPSVEESKMSGDFDDSSSFLSPTEDGSDTWSVSSEYADAKEFINPATNEDSVSERIRRKSFYSRFNQTKRRKSSQSGQLSGSRSRLPVYAKSMASDLTSPTSSKPSRKTPDPEASTTIEK